MRHSLLAVISRGKNKITQVTSVPSKFIIVSSGADFPVIAEAGGP